MNGRSSITTWLFVIPLALAGCTGGSSTQSTLVSQPVLPISIKIEPAIMSVAQGASFTFGLAASSTGRAVSWSVQEGDAGGTMKDNGTYTAPARIGSFHVIATSLVDPSKTSFATVTVPALSVVLTPSVVTLGKGGMGVFASMTDSGLPNPVVQWSVEEGAAAGTITDSGVYTAPLSLGKYHVVATSPLDLSVKGVAEVTVMQGGFSFAGSLATPRGAATATNLPNGKVLIAGGTCVCDPDFVVGTTAAELYDPVSHSVASAGHMLLARFQHTATLLKDGRTLIAGGFIAIPGLSATHDVEATKSAELYDPSTGAFSFTGTMNVPRGAHTATLLTDGRVLIAGGGTLADDMYSDFGPSIWSAEIYDPTTGTFSMTGDISTPRYLHTATTLPNGKVLITGGASRAVWDKETLAVSASDMAEIFDPSTGLFTQTGSMHYARAGHSATLLPNGKILIAGGLTDQLSSLAADGWVGAAATPTAEVFDSSTGTFGDVGAMSQPRAAQSATLLPSGLVLVVGGIDALSGSVSASAELFDPINNTFSMTGGLFPARDEHASTLLADGSVLVIGGIPSVMISKARNLRPAWSSTISLVGEIADLLNWMVDRGILLPSALMVY